MEGNESPTIKKLYQNKASRMQTIKNDRKE